MRLITLAFISLFACSLVISGTDYHVTVEYEANPVYRWYNAKSSDHFFCLDPAGETAPTGGYTFIKIGFYTLKNQENGSIPLYRLFTIQGGHLYTSDFSELETLVKAGWKPEGNIGYVFESNVLGSIAIHRYYNSVLNRQFYTVDPEDEFLTGWTYEGVVGYGFDSAKPVPAELLVAV